MFPDNGRAGFIVHLRVQTGQALGLISHAQTGLGGGQIGLVFQGRFDQSIEFVQAE
jgi:hypothetical protein